MTAARYRWGWSHHGGAPPVLTVTLDAAPVFTGIPDERADQLPWQDHRETWADWVRRSFDLTAGDRRHAIARIIAAHHLHRPARPHELAAAVRLTRPASRRGEPNMTVTVDELAAALNHQTNNQENPKMTTTSTPAPKAAKPKTGLCPECRLEVDLTRGTIKNHPAPDGAAGTLCAGSKSKPAAAPVDVAPAGNGDTSPDPVTVTPTLDHVLLEANRPPGPWAGAEALELDPRLCDADPNNPRHDLGDLDELALSLVAQGMLEPVIVAPGPTEGRYTTVAGHRRIAAAIMANLPAIPALVRADLIPGSNLSITAQVVENLHRLDLTPLDEARAYNLLRQLNMKQADIALAVGVNQGQVSKRLALLKLPEAIAAKVGDDLDVATAVELSRLPAPVRDNVADQIAKGADPEQATRRARTAVDRDAEHQALVDDLETRGVALVDFPTTFHWGRDREDRPLATGSDGEPQPYPSARTIDVTYTDHHGEPCHGATVSPRDEIVYVCLDPTRHGYKTPAEESAEIEAQHAVEDEARDVANAAAAAAVQARRDAAKQTATAERLDRTVMADTIALWAVDRLTLDPDDRELDPLELLELLVAWSDLEPEHFPEDWDGASVAAHQVATLTEAHGTHRLAYMAAIAAGELILDMPPYYRDRLAGTAVIRDHYNRLTDIAGYELTAADRALIDPPVPQGPVTPPLGPVPDGAVAWYEPPVDAVLEGDEPRWITDQAEVDAIIDGGHADRLAIIVGERFATPGMTEAENTDDLDAALAVDLDPNAPPPSSDWPATVAEAVGLPADEASPALAVDEPPAVDDPGNTPTPGERCPASRHAYNLAGNADGLECPVKCGAKVSTTASGRVRDHDVPEPA